MGGEELRRPEEGSHSSFRVVSEASVYDGSEESVADPCRWREDDEGRKRRGGEVGREVDVDEREEEVKSCL